MTKQAPATFPTFYEWMTNTRPESIDSWTTGTPMQDWVRLARQNVDAMQSYVSDPDGMIARHLANVAEEYSDITEDHRAICADDFQNYADDGSVEFSTYDYADRKALILWAWEADVNIDPFGAGSVDPDQQWNNIEGAACYAIESAVRATIEAAADAYREDRDEWEAEQED